MFASLRCRERFAFCFYAVDSNRARLWATVKTDSATGAVVPGVAGGMNPVGTQLWRQFQALGRAGLNAYPASFAFLDIDCDLTARLACHLSPRLRCYLDN
jgi:hypothetical protein